MKEPWFPWLLLLSMTCTTCDVFVSVPNRPPVARAGTDREVEVGTTVALDGSGSFDPDGDPLTFQWAIGSTPPGATAAIADPDQARTQVTPDVAGEWLLALTVDDGELASEPDQLIVKVTPSSGECRTAQDCGAGEWACEERLCICPGLVCGDGICRGEAGCCDDLPCQPDGYCEQYACVVGQDGELVVDAEACTLAGQPCPAEMFEREGLVWTMKREDLRFTHVSILNGATLTAPALDATGLQGHLVIDATGTVTLGPISRITMSGKGWGGGGGGGGSQYCDASAVCQFGRGGEPGFTGPDGQSGADGGEVQCVNQGYSSDEAGAGSGGAGGGWGGEQGHNGGDCELCCEEPHLFGDGAGGNGGGPFGGRGGVERGYGNKCRFNIYCDGIEGPSGAPIRNPPEPAEAGRRGGYAVEEGNGDASEDESVLHGSGGGGGAGGRMSAGWCCGAADGGAGGVPGGEGRPGCVGGGGGAGGGAGGGSISIRATDIVIEGEISAHGAGRADLSGGYGAGGGILLYARDCLTIGGGTVRTVGGYADNDGNPINGGTIKLFHRVMEGNVPTLIDAGRVFQKLIE